MFPEPLEPGAFGRKRLRPFEALYSDTGGKAAALAGTRLFFFDYE